MIRQTGSEEDVKKSISPEGDVEREGKVELLDIEDFKIKGNIASVLVRLKIIKKDKESTETTILFKFRWERSEWKFIDWLIKPGAYREGNVFHYL